MVSESKGSFATICLKEELSPALPAGTENQFLGIAAGLVEEEGPGKVTGGGGGRCSGRGIAALCFVGVRLKYPQLGLVKGGQLA